MSSCLPTFLLSRMTIERFFVPFVRSTAGGAYRVAQEGGSRGGGGVLTGRDALASHPVAFVLAYVDHTLCPRHLCISKRQNLNDL